MIDSILQLTRAPTVQVAMLIRRPAAEVFRAFADPAVTTRFWFTRSSGPLTTGAEVTWDWEMYGVSATARVDEVVENRLIRFHWSNDGITAVELRFTPHGENATFVEITESELAGSGDDLVTHAVGSAEGFTIALCSAKALLEHGIALNGVADRFPNGL
ncbi:SRPBCC family protein [Microlunatus speluncae]|uniref:SRPBCC family protein n=1 Tax=Microlunatus speluncae TaxID=2594267 RepID=UPI001C2DC7F3|nr:SRPBCC family protein [Microlunatus speluncae]